MSTPTWHNPLTNPPPPLTEILLAVRGEQHEASVGYRLRDGSYAVLDDHVLPASSIYAWAALPTPPTPQQLGLAPDSPTP
jgi:hypothetical protein